MNGNIQIAAGHHRVEAAKAAGISIADVYVADDLDDSDMVRIYTRENATQRGNSGTALAGSVAAALRLLAKAILTGNLSRILDTSDRVEQTISGQMEKQGGLEVGERLIVRYFHQQHIEGMAKYTVEQQLANLKASGAYARIMGEVDVEIEQEREKAQQAAEAERACVAQIEQERRENNERRRKAEAVLTGNLSRILERLSERGEQTIVGHVKKEPSLKILEENVLADEAESREHWWINHWRRQGAALLNGHGRQAQPKGQAQKTRLKFSEAARLVGVSTQRLNRAIHKGRLSAQRGGGPGKPTYIQIEDLQVWCASEGLTISIDLAKRSKHLQVLMGEADVAALIEHLEQIIEHAMARAVDQIVTQVIERLTERPER